MALVRGVISGSSLAGSRLSVRLSTSQKTAFAPSVEKAEAVAIQEIGVVIISSPGLMPAATPHRVSPVVAEVTASAYLVWHNSAKASSNSFTFFPQDGAPFLRHSISAAASSNP